MQHLLTQMLFLVQGPLQIPVEVKELFPTCRIMKLMTVKLDKWFTDVIIEYLLKLFSGTE